jgi:hypothetical protein
VDFWHPEADFWRHYFGIMSQCDDDRDDEETWFALRFMIVFLLWTYWPF